LAARPFEIDGASEDGGVAAEALLPESVAQDDVIILTGEIFSWKKCSAGSGTCAKEREKLGGDVCACEADWFALAGKVEFVAFGIGGDMHGAELISHGDECAARVGAIDADELLGMRVGQRDEKNSIHETENGGVRADAERESESSDGSEAGVFAELSKTIATIADHRTEPIASPFLANLFFHLFDTAKFDSRGALRFVRRHARANVFRYQHFEVGMNLLVKVYLHATS
jgi:hypothetical protein